MNIVGNLYNFYCDQVDIGSDHLSDDSSGGGRGGAVSDSHPETLTGTMHTVVLHRLISISKKTRNIVNIFLYIQIFLSSLGALYRLYSENLDSHIQIKTMDFNNFLSFCNQAQDKLVPVPTAFSHNIPVQDPESKS